MTIHFYWQLDVTADAQRSETGARARSGGIARDVRGPAINRYDHYAQIARAAALTGFDGLFIPHREESDDSQIVAAAVARSVPTLRLVPEFHASVGSAVYAAKQAVSFQRSTHGRLGWAIAPDADAATRMRNADAVTDGDLVARTEEFLTVARGVHGTVPFNFSGRFFSVEGGGFAAPLDRAPFPTVFLRGTSEEALALSARHADVHLFEPGPYDVMRHHIETLDAQAAYAGRSVDFGIVQPVVARETDLEAAEVRGFPSGAIVGGHALVAARLAELATLGIRHFVLSATPSLEEAYRIGEDLLPRVRERVSSHRAAA